jgi:hypothetical protein
MQMKEMSLLTFQKKFETVSKCEKYLFKQRFLNCALFLDKIPTMLS